MRQRDRSQALKWLQARRDPALEADVRRQWTLGNRGVWGDWR
ncbi:MAG TPA: hypothetical protein VLA31_05760 [Burkholderiaceae bacterium]|nr:hypothetical protein [Burkholderiaceae bacterium]